MPSPELTLRVYARAFPEVAAAPPSVNTNNYAAAASLALLRLQEGNKSTGAQLLRDSLAAI